MELEIQLIDKATKNLKPQALELLMAASQNPALHLKAEMTQAMVEINTDICETVSDVGKNIKKQIQLLHSIADKKGIDLAISGSHPFQMPWERKIFPADRYLKILEKFQWLVRRLTIFGLHVHVGMPTGERAIHVINGLIGYIPHLLALSASSPFWEGHDTGLASSRVAVFESFPTGGLPYFFVDWNEFQKCFETLKAGGAVTSIKDIYWDIRPHFDFGTVEVRICDGLPTLRDTLGLVALIQCLVVWLDSQYEKGTRPRQVHMQRYWLAPENKWQAARYGLEGEIFVQEGSEKRPIREEIKKLVEILGPVAQSLQCEKELAIVPDILKKGNSTMRQREIFTQTGSFIPVVESLVREFNESFLTPSSK